MTDPPHPEKRRRVAVAVDLPPDPPPEDTPAAPPQAQQDTPEPAPTDDPITRLVWSPESLLDALHLLHRDEESVMFQNSAGDMTFVFQSTSENTDEMMSFDLSFVYDETQDQHGKIKRLLDHEYGAMLNDEENYTMYIFTMSQQPDSTELYDTMRCLNTAYNLRFCECFEYFIKSPSLDVCYMCTMCQQPGSEVQTCTICSDPIRTGRGSIHTSCCEQWFHARCVELWRRDGIAKRCPVCRKA